MTMENLPARAAGAGPLADYQIGMRVQTREGFPGVIDDILEGPADLTTYWVTLDNNMGGGEYAEAEIWPLAAQQTASQMATQSGVERTAADDYPELENILAERLPPQITTTAAKQATNDEARDWNWSEGREDMEPGETFLDPPYPEDVAAAEAAMKLALYLPPKPPSEQSSSTTPLNPQEKQGYHEGFEQGKGGLTREPSLPDDAEYMAGFDVGWAEGVTVGRQPADLQSNYDLEQNQIAGTYPDALGPMRASADTSISPTEHLQQMEARGGMVDLGMPKVATEHEAGAFLDWLSGNPQQNENWHGVGTTWSHDWCRFRRNSHCWLSKDLNEEASKEAGYAVWNPVDRGYCFRVKWADQQKCPTGAPGPNVQGGFTDATVPWDQGGQHGGVPTNTITDPNGPDPVTGSLHEGVKGTPTGSREEQRMLTKFPVGTRVQGAPGHEGTVTDHHLGINVSQGGAVYVLWDGHDEPVKMQAATLTPIQRHEAEKRTIDMTPPLPENWKGPGIYEVDLSGVSTTGCVAAFDLVMGTVWPMAWLTWDKTKHTIEGVYVIDDYRGMGFATHLLRLAGEVAGAPLVDSGEHTDAGYQWAQRRGLNPKREIRTSTNDMALMIARMNEALIGGHRIKRLLAPIGSAEATLHTAMPLFRTTAAFEVTATWADVRRKAKRIRESGGVRVVAAKHDEVVAHVKGDHGIYETHLRRNPGKKNVAYWHCGCKWASYAWGRSPAYKRFEGRMCSHALALQYEAQARSMFGRELTLDEKQPAWMDQKHIHRPGDYRRDLKRYTSRIGPEEHAEIVRLMTKGLHPVDATYDPEVDIEGDLSPAAAALMVQAAQAACPVCGDVMTSQVAGMSCMRCGTLIPYVSTDNLFVTFLDEGPVMERAGDILKERYAGEWRTKQDVYEEWLDTKHHTASAASFFARVRGRIQRVLLDNDGPKVNGSEKVSPTEVLYPKWHPTKGLNPNDNSPFLASLSTEAMPVGPAPSGIEYRVTSNNPRNPTRSYCILGALLNGEVIGALTWGIQGRQVQDVWVKPEFRRRRIAEAMLERAKVFDPNLVHHVDRSDAGDAWVRAVDPAAPARENNTVEETSEEAPGWTLLDRLTVDEPRDWVLDVTDPYHPVDLQMARAARLLVEASGSDLKAAAKALLEMARRNEPDTTTMLSAEALTHGGQMAGLDFRFKTEASLLRKMEAETHEFGGDAGMTAANMSDSLRYTMVFPTGRYTEGARQVLADLQQAGYGERVKNYWERGDAYNGINAAMMTPKGHPFELQFHTPESLEMKESIVHPIYEKWRVESDPAKKAAYAYQMRDAFDSIPQPSGVLSIPTLKRQPMPDQKAAALSDDHKYLRLHYLHGGDTTTIVRIDDDSKVEVWKDGKWVEDSRYGRYFFKGEARSDEITPAQAEAEIAGMSKEGKTAASGRCPAVGKDAGDARRFAGDEGPCPTCGKRVRITRDGTVGYHTSTVQPTTDKRKVVDYAFGEKGVYEVHEGETEEEVIKRHEGAKKDAYDAPEVSGLVLKAADTGRILMLQRSMDDDTASGKWEFPGGHHEDGDATSLHAAIREWQEEVGQPLPEGGWVAHTWTSPNGIYQGHVLVIPSEKDLVLHQGRIVENPDDPNSEACEQVAWWDPDDARKNPALREECKASPWKQIKAAGASKVASLTKTADEDQCPRCSEDSCPNAVRHDGVLPGVYDCPACGARFAGDEVLAEVGPFAREPEVSYDEDSFMFVPAHDPEPA